MTMAILSVQAKAYDSGVGLYYFSFDYGQGKTSILRSDELSSDYKYYSVKLIKQAKLNSSILVEGGLGVSYTQGFMKYTATSDYEDQEYSSIAGYLHINPLYKVSDKLLIGVYINSMSKPVKLSETELFLVKLGANVYVDHFLGKKNRLGLFYDKTDGTTNRGIQTFGLSFQIGF